VILVHTPLGLLVMGLTLELLGLILWRTSTARIAARWMIAIGAVTAVPAATTGIYAYYDAVNPITSSFKGENVDFGSKWSELRENADKVFAPATVKGDESAETLLEHHMWRNSIATGVMLLCVLVWIGSSDRWRRRLYPVLLVILLASEGLMIQGTHEAGLAVYKHQIGQEPADARDVMTGKASNEEMLAAFVPPAQLHVTMAGFLLAFSLVALALSIRSACMAGDAAGDDQWYAGAANPTGDPAAPEVPADGATAQQQQQQFQVAPTVERTTTVDPDTGATRSTAVSTTLAPPPRLPSVRFWLLAFLCAAVAVASGLWIMGFFGMDAKGKFLSDQFMGSASVRQRFHTWLGSGIIVLTVALAIVVAVARQAKWVIAGVALLLLLAISAELWIGILLMFDGHTGPYNRFVQKKSKGETRLVIPAPPRG
jgi:hypothetical protein